MEVKIDLLVDENECAKSAAQTQGQEDLNLTMKKWVRWLHAEHSPIRVMQFRVTILGIPYYSAMHLVRHDIGSILPADMIPFVRSQRETAFNPVEWNRHESPQDQEVSLSMIGNVQWLFNTSYKRLCMHADETTRRAWEMVKSELIRHPNEYVSAVGNEMCPTCEHRGNVCHELTTCGMYPHWTTV